MIYITEHGTVGSHHTILYDEAGVCERNCWYITNHKIYVVVMRLGQDGFLAWNWWSEGYSQ